MTPKQKSPKIKFSPEQRQEAARIKALNYNGTTVKAYRAEATGEGEGSSGWEFFIVKGRKAYRIFREYPASKPPKWWPTKKVTREKAVSWGDESPFYEDNEDDSREFIPGDFEQESEGYGYFQIQMEYREAAAYLKLCGYLDENIKY